MDIGKVNIVHHALFYSQLETSLSIGSNHHENTKISSQFDPTQGITMGLEESQQLFCIKSNKLLQSLLDFESESTITTTPQVVTIPIPSPNKSIMVSGKQLSSYLVVNSSIIFFSSPLLVTYLVSVSSQNNTM